MRQRTFARLGAGAVLVATAASASLGAQIHTPGLLTGTVRDTLGQPVSQAEIKVTGTALVSRTTPDGLYLLVNVPAGRVPLVIRRLGFEPITAEIVLAPGSEMRVDIDMTPSPALLEEVEVEGVRSLNSTKLDDFHRRRENANGFFLTEEQIQLRNSQNPTELLRTMHRVKIIPLRAGFGNLVRIGTGKAQCTPAIYLDGLKVNEGFVDAIPIQRIIAIEVYPRAVDVPLPYTGNYDCGVIGFWMRTGADPNRPPQGTRAKKAPVKNETNDDA
jgi:hypothetical protein